ncbi:conserved hypothetical protein [Methylobacterium sp. 4-46]|uniref:hypothetical protein n=1 Tax=unclassified Methylobacterium TaxID=2615210 RepID=UPI000165CC8D|nr:MULTISPECIES: hypothetical protein [Methylobacterium]ACA19687.1 conserved hypothetical protein [Methylobacterium sp. 4-46]WFT78884.1 hypothetical protein QA634_27020 [Methylobacterium nodulans]
MRHALATLLLLGPLAAPALAQGAPRSVADCERIRGDLAYNQCLSLFGPAAPTKGAALPAETTEVRLPAAGAAAEAEPAPAYRGRRRAARRYHRGRQSASFAVASGRHRRR